MNAKLHWASHVEWPLPEENLAEGINQCWVQAWAAQRLADVLARLAIGDRLFNLPEPDQAFFNKLAETTITSVVSEYEPLTKDGDDDADPRPRPRQRLPLPPT